MVLTSPDHPIAAFLASADVALTGWRWPDQPSPVDSLFPNVVWYKSSHQFRRINHGESDSPVPNRLRVAHSVCRGSHIWIPEVSSALGRGTCRVGIDE